MLISCNGPSTSSVSKNLCRSIDRLWTCACVSVWERFSYRASFADRLKTSQVEGSVVTSIDQLQGDLPIVSNPPPAPKPRINTSSKTWRVCTLQLLPKDEVNPLMFVCLTAPSWDHHLLPMHLKSGGCPRFLCGVFFDKKTDKLARIDDINFFWLLQCLSHGIKIAT